ncbi:arylamine N-acetyltransferase [Micromonospora sp. PLK6-60]|uniref:arylamine N-acetyltransferase family protein n=1 Tax=Micromonospora sp. PLK6-60 TaxID=2873383 RepID=UPI001CA6D35F|nr:arylamine N-acetyltransferase [Micromonospora sp. PLK6-60]MBY8872481.1 arylamine N-acetyltransferase [Micromonospora sp. PLK6-60]
MTATPAPPLPVPDPARHWTPDALDLDAYLKRVGHRGPVAPDGRTLRELHRAHVAAIPFENLDVLLGRGIAVDLARVQDKLVHAGRGGYCYEHGVLFGAVLQRLGYRVDRLLARTGDPAEQPRPRSHLVLRVDDGDLVWLADVGFGSGLLEPIPLVEGNPRRQGAWHYQLRRGADGGWRLQERTTGAWSTLLTFTEEPQYPVDVEVANHNTATSPQSPFTQRCIVVRKGDATVRRLIGRDYAEERPGAAPRSRSVTDEEYGSLLAGTFGLALDPAELRALLATLPPPGADQPTAPDLELRRPTGDHHE